MFINGQYKSLFSRFIHSVLIETPAQVWFRFLSLVIPSSKQFINYTSVSDAVLIDAWKKAQLNLATKSFPMSGQGTSNAHPPDQRAMSVHPSNVAVVSVPDTKISDLVKVDPRWGQDHDPSGAIIIPMGQGFLEYQTDHAMTFTWVRPRVYAAESQIPIVLEYEFENIILSRIGYNIEGR